MVMKMKGSKDILSSILKTTQMGQIGIRSILNEPLQPSLRTELRNELLQNNIRIIVFKLIGHRIYSISNFIRVCLPYDIITNEEVI